LTVLSQRNSVAVDGKVVSVWADRLSHQFMPYGYYLARVAQLPGGRRALAGRNLHPGIRSGLMTVNSARPTLSYFMKPATDSFNRSFREE
jgi:HlyD family secretion protein